MQRNEYVPYPRSSLGGNHRNRTHHAVRAVTQCHSMPYSCTTPVDCVSAVGYPDKSVARRVPRHFGLEIVFGILSSDASTASRRRLLLPCSFRCGGGLCFARPLRPLGRMKLTPFWNHLWRSARASAAARALRLQRSGCLTPAEPVATCEASNTNGSSSRINRKNMCGRGRQAAAPAYYIDAARKHLHVPTEKGCAWKRQDDWRPTENLAPGHRAVVLVAGSNSNNSPPHLCTKTWGLVPSFDGASQPDYWRMFNARSEGLTTSPVFRRLLKDRRCAVPLDGFFEWTADEMPKLSGASGGGKQPWYVHRKGDGHGEPLWVAGLHESSRDGELETFTLITRDVDPCLDWLHDRMPVILDAAGLHACSAPRPRARSLPWLSWREAGSARTRWRGIRPQRR